MQLRRPDPSSVGGGRRAGAQFPRHSGVQKSSVTTPTRAPVRRRRAREATNLPITLPTPTAMSSKGVKRASPGAETEKNPFGDVELTDEDAVKLQGIQKDIARVELALGAFEPAP